jgi:hypothetical protein
MIELLLVQTITTLALAFFVIKLRRELYPMIAGAGPTYASFWIRSVDVLVVEAPQFEVSKTVIRVRWLFSEELFLIHSLKVYDVAMRPSSRVFYRSGGSGCREAVNMTVGSRSRGVWRGCTARRLTWFVSTGRRRRGSSGRRFRSI